MGVLLFLGSFGLLFWNEGRVDVSLIAKDAIQIDATQQNAGDEGKLVAASGHVTADAPLGDGMFLKPGKYLEVKRTAEMYAWTEEKDEKTTKNVGGSETTETTYTYKKDWTDSPDKSSDFQHPEGHENPVPSIENDTVTADVMHVGNYALTKSLELPSGDKVSLTADNTTVTSSTGAVLANQSYIFIASTTSSSMSSPQVGDMRISYDGVPADQQLVVFGQLQGSNLQPFAAKGETLYRAFVGTKDTAVADLHGEYTMLTWILRLVGFLMMWIGLSMFLEPISTILDILPIAGSLGRGLTGGVAFVISLVLTAITVIVSMILHSVVAIIIALVIAIAAGIMIMKQRQKTSATPTPTA